MFFREWEKILSAPVKSLRDRSLDWQDVDLVSDAIRSVSGSSGVYRMQLLELGQTLNFCIAGNRLSCFPIKEIEQG
jgi:hypothetical protein